jgi:hypothetical protein
MSITSLTYPGVEVKEKDLGVYGASSAQVKVLVSGFTSKGEIKTPIECYNIQTYLDNFGEPQNDAEFYTYVAAVNAIKAGGVAVVCRLPYTNAASSSYQGIAVKFAAPTLITDVSMAEVIDADLVTALTGQFGATLKLSVVNTEKIAISESQYELAFANGDFASAPADGEVGDTISDANFLLIDYKRTIASDDIDSDGIFYVLFDPIAAINCQRLISDGNDSSTMMNCVTKIFSSDGTELTSWSTPLSGSIAVDSISRQIIRQFPAFTQTVNTETGVFGIEATYNNHIGIAVCKIGKADSTISYQNVSVMESFVGSVIPTSDKITRQSKYIVDIVNYGSNYIKMCANRLNQVGTTAATGSTVGMKPMPLYGELIKIGSDADSALATFPSNVQVVSFAHGSDVKLITGSSVAGHLQEVINQVSNVDDTQIDIFCDAGLSSVAQFTSDNNVDDNAAFYEPDIDISNGVVTTATQIANWSAIGNIYEQAASGIRKDCVALLDFPRNVTIKGSEKLVNNKISGSSFNDVAAIGSSIVAATQNSSYSAMYANWAKMVNPYTGKITWVPMSCFAAYACAVCDLQYNSWDAPAFLERGTISGIIDLSLAPDAEIESFLYTKSINYAKYFSSDGYVIWGQKTTQKAEGAFSRLNVRRSILRHERYIRETLRRFIGKNNTTFTRRSAIDVIDPYMRKVKSQNGVYDYLLVCDETNNPDAVIDANELNFAALMQPVKTAEKITATIAVTNTGANLSEYVSLV